MRAVNARAMVSDLQPVLDGPTLTLRPLAAADWTALFAIADDPAIWAMHPAHDRWREPVFRAFFDEGLASGGSLIVLDRASGAIIGHSRYSFDEAQPGEVEIGWTFLARTYWGGAANAELKALMIAYAYTFADAVILRIGEDNLRSRRACEKIGGVLTDRTQVADATRGGAVHVIYRIAKHERTGT